MDALILALGKGYEKAPVMFNQKIQIMKKIYTLILMGILGAAHAQVPNNGFEQTLPDGISLKNWGAYYPIPVSFDPVTGESTSDQIWFDNGQGFSFGVTDCWTGSLAMYISNAFNATTNEAIPGFARLFNDEISETASGWNYGIPIPENTEINILGFDCKFSPMGSDVAIAKLELFDEASELTGFAEIILSQPMWDFQYVYAPVQTVSSNTPVMMHISFGIKNASGNVNWGSSMVVDNVVVNWDMLGTSKNTAGLFKVYPTVSSEKVNIDVTQAGQYELNLTDLSGKTIRKQSVHAASGTLHVDVSALQNGLYLLGINHDGYSQTTKIIKK